MMSSILSSLSFLNSFADVSKWIHHIVDRLSGVDDEIVVIGASIPTTEVDNLGARVSALEVHPPIFELRHDDAESRLDDIESRLNALDSLVPSISELVDKTYIEELIFSIAETNLSNNRRCEVRNGGQFTSSSKVTFCGWLADVTDFATAYNPESLPRWRESDGGQSGPHNAWVPAIPTSSMVDGDIYTYNFRWAWVITGTEYTSSTSPFNGITTGTNNPLGMLGFVCNNKAAGHLLQSYHSTNDTGWSVASHSVSVAIGLVSDFVRLGGNAFPGTDIMTVSPFRWYNTAGDATTGPNMRWAVYPELRIFRKRRATAY